MSRSTFAGELVARRVPLYRFVLGNVVARYDLDRADGRVDALREAARLVTSVRDRAKVDAFARELAGMIGVEVDEARAEVRRAAGRGPQASRGERRPAPDRAADRAADPGDAPPVPSPRQRAPDPRDPRFAIERETLKLVIQHPESVGRTATDVGANDFTHPTYRGVWGVVSASGGPQVGATEPGWAARLRDAGEEPEVVSAISALGTEPLKREPDPAYVAQHVYRLQELTVLRRIADLKSRLQRTNPVEHAVDYNKMFGELVALEQHRRELRERTLGSA